MPDLDEQDQVDVVTFRAVARPSRRGPVLILVSALAVMAFAVLTKGPAPIEPSPTRAPTSALVVAPGPSATAPASSADVVTFVPSFGPPNRNPDARPFPVIRPTPVAAGAHRLVPAGTTDLRLRVTLPSGWALAGTDYVRARGAGSVGLSIGAWSLFHVMTYPCRWSADEIVDEPLMRSVRGQAEALSSWWGQDPGFMPGYDSGIAPLATEPVGTTLLGRDAMYVEVLTPLGFDLGACDAGQMAFWDAADGAVRIGAGPGERQRLWVVDVDGERLVIDAALPSTASTSELVQLQSVVDSLAIEP